MIRNIGSDLASFKALAFNPGLNILLADKSEGATDRQSRNGAGKTSLIELMHFLCCANASPGSRTRAAEIADSTFTLRMDIGDADVTIARSGNKPSKIKISGSVDSLPISTKLTMQQGSCEISNEQWKSSLGALWFGIEEPLEPATKYGPSFRSLFSYFARRQESGGFQTPVQHTGKQLPWDQQVAVSFLIGLNWRIPSDLQRLKDKEKIIKGLAKAAKSGDLGKFVGRSADLRTQLAVAERRSDALSIQLKTFQVIPEYQELQSEADEITGRINQLGEENFVDTRLVKDLEESLVEEQEPQQEDLIRLYEEAGVLLPGVICQRLDDARAFHRAIVENRRSHLGAEISSASLRIEHREQEQLDLDARRRQIMEILQSGGALEQYTGMREELGRAQGEIENLRQRLTAAEEFERSNAEQDIERSRLAQALNDDIHEQEDIVKEAIVTFESLSEALYEEAGSLVINPTPNGPLFEMKIDGERSKGITNMQIFCFDMMLTELNCRRGRSPGFLVHDSHLFDGVDERQIAKALQLGAQRSEELGFQYIVTMNSDVLPSRGYQSGFDVQDYVLPTKLTDATETGGLFGLRF